MTQNHRRNLCSKCIRRCGNLLMPPRTLILVHLDKEYTIISTTWLLPMSSSLLQWIKLRSIIALRVLPRLQHDYPRQHHVHQIRKGDSIKRHHTQLAYTHPDANAQPKHHAQTKAPLSHVHPIPRIIDVCPYSSVHHPS